jgi:hypothetical protein
MARGALTGGGCVGGFLKWLGQPQIGHADLARRTFVGVELCWNSLFVMLSAVN